MKKIISLILMLAMMISVSAFAEEKITFYNGIEFGMARSEVKESFKGQGVELEDCYTGALAEHLAIRNIDWQVGQSKIPVINAYFDENDELYAINYNLIGNKTSDGFWNFEMSFSEKYGETEFSSKTDTRMYSQAGAILYKQPLSEFYDMHGRPITDRVVDFTQRLILHEDGTATFIEHMLTYSPSIDIYTHTLTYKFISEEDMHLFEADSLDMSGF